MNFFGVFFTSIFIDSFLIINNNKTHFNNNNNNTKKERRRDENGDDDDGDDDDDDDAPVEDDDDPASRRRKRRSTRGGDDDDEPGPVDETRGGGFGRSTRLRRDDVSRVEAVISERAENEKRRRRAPSVETDWYRESAETEDTGV